MKTFLDVRVLFIFFYLAIQAQVALQHRLLLRQGLELDDGLVVVGADGAELVGGRPVLVHVLVGRGLQHELDELPEDGELGYSLTLK